MSVTQLEYLASLWSQLKISCIFFSISITKKFTWIFLFRFCKGSIYSLIFCFLCKCRTIWMRKDRASIPPPFWSCQVASKSSSFPGLLNHLKLLRIRSCCTVQSVSYIHITRVFASIFFTHKDLLLTSDLFIMSYTETMVLFGTREYSPVNVLNSIYTRK